MVLGWCWEGLEPCRVYLEHSWGRQLLGSLEAVLGLLGRFGGAVQVVLGLSGAVLGRSWEVLELAWGFLGQAWGRPWMVFSIIL